MSDSEVSAREADLSKKDRLVNAWLAAGPDAMAKNIAEITDSSIAYASRIKSEMEDGDIGEEEVDEVRDEALVDEYADRLQRLTQGNSDTGAAGGGEAEAATEPDEPGETQAEQSEQRQPSALEAQQHHQERQQEAAQRESGQQPQEPSQRQPQQPQRPQQPQQPQQSQRPQQPQQPQQPQRQSQQPQQRQPERPPQQQPRRQPARQQPPRRPQQPPQRREQREFPAEERDSVSVERLRELDQLLATYEEEARFEIQNLPQGRATEAVGKLFVAEKARSLLHEMVGDDGNEQPE